MASEIQTAPGEGEDTTPQRGATRAPVKKPVRLQFDDAIDVVEARCHNVSIGGMFVHSKEGRPVGSLVRFELMLDEDMSIRGLAEVVWMRSQDHGPERVAGMGLKFRFLEQRDRQLIFKLVSQHIKERLAARHPGLGDGPDEEDVPDPPPPIRKPPSTMERVARPADMTPKSAKPAEAKLVTAASADVLPSIDDLDDLPGAPASPDAAQPGGPATSASPSPPPAEDESGQRSLLFRGDDEGRGAGPAPEPTGAWLQQGLQSGAEAGFEDTEGFADDDEADYRSYDAYDEDLGDSYDDEPYETELYGDDTHFENRPKQRRDVPILTLVAVLVTVLAVSAYLWGDRLFDLLSSGDDVTSAPLAADAGSQADPTAGDPQAADSASDPGAETGADVASASASEGDAGPASSTGADPVPEPVKSPPPPPPPTATSQGSSGASAPPFRAVRDISARVAGPAVEIVITTDGSVESGRFSHARLPDGAPRELIKLRGLTQRFDTERIPVGIGAVRQVRTGWHRKSSGNELHIVVDLAAGSAEVTGVRVEGNRIIVSIKG